MCYKADNLVTSRYKIGYDSVCLSAAELHHRIIKEKLERLQKWSFVAYFKSF